MRPAARTGAVLVVAAVLFASISISVALAATSIETYYLVADTEPIGSLKVLSPTRGALPNYDPDRDIDALGLVLKESDKGMSEADPEKYQQWQMPLPGLHISGSPTLRIWSVMKDFKEDKAGQFDAFLLDCASSCAVLDSTRYKRPEGANWSQAIVGFSSIDRILGPGHSLAVRIVVSKDSQEDMWFAYDTTTYKSRLEVPIPLVITTTTTAPTTTTTTNPTTTTTAPTTTTTKPWGTTSTSSTTTTLGAATTMTTLLETPTTTTLDGNTTTTVHAGTSTTQSSTGLISPTTTTPASPDARPLTTATEKTSLVVRSGELGVAANLFESSQKLSPQEGLMVTFLSAAETVRSQLLASVALGIVGSLLVIFGMRRRTMGA